MAVELKQHYVAFLDVLGFSEMVRSDVREEKQVFLTKLFRCHQGAVGIFKNEPNCSITQFSDSIVIARPYDDREFEYFITCVAEYQRLLLDEGLLCRGGIAVDKHFSNGTFTFSAGLISAYIVESTAARYPRVVVSRDVLDLVFPDFQKISKGLVKEDDGLIFVDYLGVTFRKKPMTLRANVRVLVENLAKSAQSSVREKGLWLAAYADATFKTRMKGPRFRRNVGP